MLSQLTVRRIQKEMGMLQQDPIIGISAEPVDEKLDKWLGKFRGPEGSPYENGEFKVSIIFGADYPCGPPKVRMITKVFHCNISVHGGICLDILKRNWSPALTVQKLLLSLMSLLADPNPRHGLNQDAINMYLMDKKQYEKTAREWTEKYA
ncbi:SUMO-conjugating enzyme UBC9-like [Teleopsis dalmanni]|uniref:SUMO-conjugating enzyme UBC9-like n=1 Tax=Teleopsis dalmanni TaxID=139649 RepID=UPI0018CE6C0B|nr:SUMO-conjugating enzyme UBC9-like [Teleopsis dalmanni]